VLVHSLVQFVSFSDQRFYANLKPRKVVKPPRKVFLYNKANTEKISENLKAIDLNSLMIDQNPNIDQ
jgi:hypothetical protein